MSGAPLSHLLPPLPGFTALARTHAQWPVWSGSTTKPIRFAAMPKKAAVRRHRQLNQLQSDLG